MLERDDILKENKDLKSQIAQLQNVIVSMCVLNQKQTALKVPDKHVQQPKRMHKRFVTEYSASSKKAAYVEPCPENLIV